MPMPVLSPWPPIFSILGAAVCSVIAANTEKGRRWKRYARSSLCTSTLLQVALSNLVVGVLIAAAVRNVKFISW